MFWKCKWILSLFAFLFSSCMAQVSKPSPARLGAVRGEDWHQERLVTIWILDPGTDQDNYLPPCWRGSLRIYPKSFNGWSWEGRLAVSTCFFQKKHGKKMHKDAPFRHRQAWQLTFGSAWWVRASGDLGGWRSCGQGFLGISFKNGIPWKPNGKVQGIVSFLGRFWFWKLRCEVSFVDVSCKACRMASKVGCQAISESRSRKLYFHTGQMSSM